MPTHTVVLGDLLGSQWIGDEEFERRAERFWGTVFGEGERVDWGAFWNVGTDAVMDVPIGGVCEILYGREE